MFGINLREVLVAAVGVAFIFGSLFLPPFYGTILGYAAVAICLFLIARWVFRRRRTPPQ